MLLFSVSLGNTRVLDTDGDGVSDAEDICPTIVNAPGLFLGVAGCEDTDNDGYEDTFWDECPGVFGLLSGCPEIPQRKLLADTAVTVPTGTFTFPACDTGQSCPCTAVVPGDSFRNGDLFLIQIKNTTHTSLPFEITE